MSVRGFPEWQKLCEDALEERAPEKLLRRVVAAETAIFERLRGMGSRPENVELETMVAVLIKLRRAVAKAVKVPTVEEKVAKKLLRNRSDGLKQNATKKRAQPLV